MKPLEYLFYRALTWKLRDKGERFPFFASVAIVAMLLSVNVATLVLAGEKVDVTHSWPVMTRGDRGLLGMAVWGGWCLLLRNRWVRDERSRAILDQFSGESRSLRMRHTVFMWSYIVVSLCAPVAVVVVQRLSR